MDFIDLKKQQELIRKNIDDRISKVLNHGQYILGPEVKELENELSLFLLIIIISLKKKNKSRKWSQANENGIIGKIVYFLLLEIMYCHCIPEINEEIIAP